MLFLSLHPKNKQFGRLNLPTKQAIPFSHSSFRKMRVQKESRRGSQSGDKPVRTSLRGQRLPPSALAFGGAAQAPEFLTRTGQWLTKASGGGGQLPYLLAIMRWIAVENLKTMKLTKSWPALLFKSPRGSRSNISGKHASLKKSFIRVLSNYCGDSRYLLLLILQWPWHPAWKGMCGAVALFPRAWGSAVCLQFGTPSLPGRYFTCSSRYSGTETVDLK